MIAFQYDSYREILREVLKIKKAKLGRAYTYEKMADACDLHRPYLSLVLNGNGHLNGDQVYLACKFLQFSDDEYKYTSLLHEWERSSCAARKKMLHKKIVRLKTNSLKSEAVLKNPPISNAPLQPLDEFCLDSNAGLVHLFLTVDSYRQNLESIRQKLNLSHEVFQQILDKIERAGLISRESHEIKVLQDSFHISTSSPLFPAIRLQRRFKALELLQKNDIERQYSFTSLFSATDEVRQKFLSRFFEFLEWAEQQARPAEPKQVFQMNFDLLTWSD